MEGKYFYKIFIAPSSQSQNLRIPEDYVKENKRQFSKNYVKLRGEDGRVWRVKVLKQSGKVLLVKGWDDFVKGYSIKYGYFLLFKYNNAGPEFVVRICDATGFEIKYDNRLLEYQTEEDDLAQQITEITSQSQVFCVDSGDDDDDEQEKNNVPKLLEDGVESNTGVAQKLDFFKSKNPYFNIIMKPNNVSKGKNNCRLYFPFSHVRKYLKPLSRHVVILKEANNEKTYDVWLIVYNHNSQAFLGRGWRKFVKEINLRVGDGCVFELVDKKNNVYKVTIFRAEAT